MFDKLMNSYYFGKSGKGDYRREDLPRTRWQLFWEMLRVRFSGLLRLNLLYMLIWLPTIVVLMLGGLAMMGTLFPAEIVMADDPAAIVEEGVLPAGEGEAAVEAELLDPEQMAAYLQSILTVTLMLLIPCIAITGPFTAGLSYVTRNWARDEHAFALSDFLDAVKENWKPSLVCSLITSLVPAVIYICWSYYGELANDHLLMVVPQMLTVMLGLMWCLAVTYTYPMIVSYRMRLKDVLRNSMLLAIGRLPMSVGVRLLHCVPALIASLVILYISAPWGMFGLAAYYMLIGFGLSRFVTASYTNAVFDRYINSRIEGARVNRGLNTEPEEDEEEDEEEE